MGAVVIIAPTGEILALVSTPSFDPATFEKDFPSFSASNKGELDQPRHLRPLSNRLIDRSLPSTLALTDPPALPIPTRAADRNKTTPLQMALLTTSLLNDGVMPSPQLLITNYQSQLSRPIAIMSRDTAAQLREKIKRGYAISMSGQQTLGWFIGFVGENAICIVVENGTGEEAKGGGNIS